MIRFSNVVVVLVALLALGPLAAGSQHPSRPARPATPPRPADPHGGHGTPEGWKLTWPEGDPERGREVFARFECYKCHEVKGQSFPGPTDREAVGPELSAMGPLHDPEYFAEAIVNPTATIEKGKGYQAPDGSSKMPSFNDSMTVQELIDLVAFLRGLRPPAAGPGGPRGH